MERNVFLAIFGKANAKILDYLLDQEVDVSITDICDGAKISRKTADTFLAGLVAQDIVIITRTVGNTKMYSINLKNPISQKLQDLNELILQQQEHLLETPITTQS
jgi:predicted transcriptional regulator